MLKQQGSQKWIFDEVNKITVLNYTFKIFFI